MNGVDLINNLIDELGRAKALCLCLLKGQQPSESDLTSLCEDITTDLDRYYDVADSIDALVEDMEV